LGATSRRSGKLAELSWDLSRVYFTLSGGLSCVCNQAIFGLACATYCFLLPVRTINSDQSTSCFDTWLTVHGHWLVAASLLVIANRWFLPLPHLL
jgi:hypothetical protein